MQYKGRSFARKKLWLVKRTAVCDDSEGDAAVLLHDRQHGAELAAGT